MTIPLQTHRLVFLKQDVDVPGVEYVGHYRYRKAAPALIAHRHRDALEICLLQSGEQSYRVGGQLYRLRGGDQFVTFPNEVHDTAGCPEEHGELYWIILKLKPGLLFLPKVQSHSFISALVQMPSRRFVANQAASQVMNEIFEVLHQPKSSLRAVILAGLINRYLILTWKASMGIEGKLPSLLIQRCLQYIQNHLADPLEVSTLAEIGRISISRFKARFKQEVGVPPMEYVLRRKIEKACSLLSQKGTRISVTQAAFDLGFSSSQYFATVFRRYTGTSPTAFLGNPKFSLGMKILSQEHTPSSFQR